MAETEKWSRNRKQLKESIDNCDFLLLAANSLMQRNNDSSYRFEQDSTFYYYTGLQQPDLIYAADLLSGDEWLVMPSYSQAERTFDGHTDAKTLTSISGIETLQSTHGWRRIRDVIHKNPQAVIGFAKHQTEPKGRLSINQAHPRLLKKIGQLGKRASLKDITQVIERQRAIKQPWELQLMEQAVDVTARALDTLLPQLKKLVYEYEIEADITASLIRQNAQHAYEPIIANGRNALTLHYVKNDAKLQRDVMVLIDVGAQVEHYCADISRTYPLDGTFDTRQRELYQAVLDLQQYTIDLIKPGLALSEYVRQVEARSKETLHSIGLPQSALHNFMPHSVSHGLGLDVHEKLASSKFMPGMVLTVEPGLYIQEEGIGIRVEDDVVVTSDGNKVLSRNIPKQVHQIEEKMNG